MRLSGAGERVKQTRRSDRSAQAELRADQIDGSETRDIHLTMRTGELHFKGQAYLLTFLLPNLYFHSTATYAILREAGVPIGKTDFIGATD